MAKMDGRRRPHPCHAEKVIVMELVDKEVVLSALDKLINARERCRNCSLRNTVEYNTIVYVRKILEKVPVVSEQEAKASAKKKKPVSA